MGEIVAAFERCFAAHYRVNEAAFFVDIPRHHLLYQFAWIPALLSGRLRESRFLLGCEMDFHEAQSTRKLPTRQGLEFDRHGDQGPALPVTENDP
jgi:hypothetical protein